MRVWARYIGLLLLCCAVEAGRELSTHSCVSQDTPSRLEQLVVPVHCKYTTDLPSFLSRYFPLFPTRPLSFPPIPPSKFYWVSMLLSYRWVMRNSRTSPCRSSEPLVIRCFCWRMYDIVYHPGCWITTCTLPTMLSARSIFDWTLWLVEWTRWTDGFPYSTLCMAFVGRSISWWRLR